MNYRPVFPIDVIPEGHPMLTSGISQPSGVRAGQPFPGGYGAKWFWWDMETLSNSAELLTQQAQVVEMPSANAFYAYGHPFSWSANTGTERSNTINLFFLKDEDGTFFSFYIIDKAWDGDGGDYKMTLTATAPVVRVFNATEMLYYDRYENYFKGDIPGATTWKGNRTVDEIPIMLRDDPWNVYTYDKETGKAEFHWYWLECCTDGMIVGPLPSPSKEALHFNITWEGHCDNMINLDQGTRIQQWHPFKNDGSWIHYDVPMEQTCHEYHGIQLSARSCDEWCDGFNSCGECTAQYGCSWSAETDSCQMIGLSGIVGSQETTYKTNRCCSECSAITTAHTCISEPGCGWAPFEEKCVSGTPDFPCDDTVTVIQWEPPAYCYKVSYNEKRAFGSFTRMEDYGVQPVTRYTSEHPKMVNNVANCATGKNPYGEWGAIWDEQDYLTRTLNAGDYLARPILGMDYWSYTGASSCNDPSVKQVPGVEAFYAYGYPHAMSSNTGKERSGYVSAFLLLDTAGDVYMVMTVDAAGDGSGGFLRIDMEGSEDVGSAAASVKLMGPPLPAADERDVYKNTWSTHRNASVSFEWDGYNSDGMIMGPFPKSEWSLNMKVVAAETSGLEEFCIGTYDSEKNDIGCITIGIKKATAPWGGVQFDALDCTTFCQRYSDCGECSKDSNCQYAPQNGGCIAKGAYVYDFGCPRPAFAPLTKMMSRSDAAFQRESSVDDWDSTAVLRVAMDRIDMTCPCDVQYRISATVYSETMKPLHVINDVKPRLDYRYTFVDIPGMVNNTCYKIFSYICIAQGTLGRDDCSPAKIDDYCTSFPPNAYPPPSPPPFPPYVDGTPPTGGLGEFLTGDGGGITRVAAEPEYQGKRWDPFYPPGREGECPPPLKGPNYGNWYTYADGNGLG